MAPNSRGPCMSDRFMIPSERRAAACLCSGVDVFGAARFHHAVLASGPRAQNVTDATLSSQQSDWHSYSAQISGLWGGDVSLDFSLLLRGLFRSLPVLVWDRTKSSRKEADRHRLNPPHARTEGPSLPPHQNPKSKVMARTFKFVIIRCDLHGSEPKRSWQRDSCLLSIPTAWTGERKRRSGSSPGKRQNSPKAGYAELPGAEVRIHATSFKVKSMQYLLNWHQPGVAT